MKILIMGGTGFLGTALTQALIEHRHQVCILTRNASKTTSGSKNPEFLFWNGADLPQMNDIDVLINLAGAPIQKGRWTRHRKNLILESRVQTTELLSHAIIEGRLQPKIFLSGSAIGYYGNGKCQLLNEGSPKGEGFLSQVAEQWENAALKCNETPNAAPRLVLLRTGVVLGDGGALPLMSLPFKWGLGGALGSGDQYLPWIHIEDWVGIVLHCIEQPHVSGPVNLCAPKPVTMKQFSALLASRLNRPCFFQLPELLLKLALGELSEVVIYSQNAHPEQALRTGYCFKYPDLNPALSQLLHKKS